MAELQSMQCSKLTASKQKLKLKEWKKGLIMCNYFVVEVELLQRPVPAQHVPQLEHAVVGHAAV